MTFHEHVTMTETDYGVVLLDLRSGQYFQLNPTAATVVRILRDGGDVAGAVDAVVGAFDVDRQRAEQDVTALLSDLRDSGVLAP
ncbi:coenzyme PQQ synthesis protein D (PqqD) [Amycolatopsis cihanbeyliensis]|uniref:Coenzyme PQQ synthesis protein D (PqqD) n=2 Tax=Amycolatopsis cihanbeyliensis TaxID=1128664 RepID=A0A542DE52_AMYCI|nr:coenzyme PQQ synthesis protein D (PqqD) [Amycolatopsis cihanbeyliensis]